MPTVGEKSPFSLSPGFLSANAFHEKAGQSQVGSFVFSWDKVFSPPPSCHCRHLPSALFEERFCSLGASWVFSFQPVPRPVAGNVTNHRQPAAATAFAAAIDSWARSPRSSRQGGPAHSAGRDE